MVSTVRLREQLAHSVGELDVKCARAQVKQSRIDLFVEHSLDFGVARIRVEQSEAARFERLRDGHVAEGGQSTHVTKFLRFLFLLLDDVRHFLEEPQCQRQ